MSCACHLRKKDNVNKKVAIKLAEKLSNAKFSTIGNLGHEVYPIPSNFISCVYQFVPHKDWSTITPNSIFCCKCKSKDESIQKVTIEFKCGDNLFKFYEQTFLINSDYSEIKIRISYDIMPQKHLKDISEICFVIRPNFVKNFIGEIEIGELKFQDSIITNF